MIDQALDIDSSIIGSLSFILMKICRRVQGCISTIFWTIFIKPVLFLAKVIGSRKRRPVEAIEKPVIFITLDELKRGHRILLHYLKWLFKISKILNGVVPNIESYAKLLTWSRQIPVIAFRDETTSYTIEILQKKYPDGKRGLDIIWISSYKAESNFRIVSKEIADQGQRCVVIKCLWISGKDQGKIFEIDKNFPFGSSSRVPEWAPTAIYYPPRLFVVLMEMIISAGAILAFLQLTQGGWVLLKSFLETTVRAVIDGWALLIYTLIN